MFNSNSNHNSKTTTNSTNATSWHPIQTTASYDLWELPHPSRELTFDEGDQLHHLEAQSIGSIATSWSFSSTDNARQRLSTGTSQDNENNATSLPQSESNKKKPALGDATNTAPVLRIPRSRYL